MSSLATKIKLYANREIDFRRDVRINVDVNGINGSIIEWNLDIPKPTMAQLDAFEEQAAFEIAITNLRNKRNQLLKDSDYTVLQDSVLTSAKKSEWMVYRTNLRNITQGLTTVDQVNAVVFPLKPQN